MRKLIVEIETERSLLVIGIFKAPHSRRPASEIIVNAHRL